MGANWRIVVLSAVIVGVAGFSAARITSARSACLADGGTYALASLSCTAKPRPIYLNRGILRG
jgi:hypothetical protein